MTIENALKNRCVADTSFLSYFIIAERYEVVYEFFPAISQKGLASQIARPISI